MDVIQVNIHTNKNYIWLYAQVKYPETNPQELHKQNNWQTNNPGTYYRLCNDLFHLYIIDYLNVN